MPLSNKLTASQFEHRLTCTGNIPIGFKYLTHIWYSDYYYTCTTVVHLLTFSVLFIDIAISFSYHITMLHTEKIYCRFASISYYILESNKFDFRGNTKILSSSSEFNIYSFMILMRSYHIMRRLSDIFGYQTLFSYGIKPLRSTAGHMLGLVVNAKCTPWLANELILIPHFLWNN